MANTSINLTSLDFDTYKANLQAYLQNQPQFSDYNFAGSNISVLLDILAYNTYQNAFYLNMVASEMFLDSAQLVSSVISKAKELNYVPRSYTSAVSFLNLVFPQNGLNTFTIPQGTRFTGKNSNTSYTFVTKQATVVYPQSNTFVANNLPIYEGIYINDSFVVDYSVQNQQFILSNKTIDTSSLVVSVSENNGVSNSLFSYSSSLFGVANTSNVYFIQATQNNLYQIVFGDGIFGRTPKNGAIVYANYISTSGSDGNGVQAFNLADNLGPVNGQQSAIIPIITTINSSYNGANSESIDSIRYNAPRSYQTQERAVTVNDYVNLIVQNFPDIKNAHVFGGELANTVSYGQVFISTAAYSGFNLSDSEKAQIVSFLSTRNVLGITPVVIDPDYLYLNVTSSVKYKSSATTLTATGIQTLVSNTIVQYSNTNLNDFDTEFRFSDFLSTISNTDASIFSNETSVTMKKIIQPALNITTYATINYRNPINVGSVYSSSFLNNGRTYQYTDYNPNANNIAISQSNSGLVASSLSNLIYLTDITAPGQYVYSPGGTVDYTAGTVTLSPFTITDYLGAGGVIMYATPSNENVKSYKNDILTIDTANGINISVKAL